MAKAPAKLLLLLIAPAILLAACGDKTPQKALALLEANQFSEAATLAEKALADKPDDPFYHGVMAEVLTEQCVRGNCPASKPETLDSIRQHLSHIQKPITLDEGQSINIYARLAPIVERFISVHNATKSYAMFVERALPEGVNKRHFLSEIENFAQQAMSRGDIDDAVELLKNITQLGNPDTPAVTLSRFMLAFIESDGSPSAALQAEIAEVLAKTPKEEEAFVANIPHMALIKAKKAQNDKNLMQNYASILAAPFSEMGLKKLETEKNKKLLADEVYKLSRDQGFLEQIQNGTDDTTEEQVKVALLKAALLHHPQNEEIWNVFFPLAIENIDAKGGSLRFVYNNIDLTRIPAAVVVKNNELLLKSANEALKERKDVSPYLQEIIYRRDADQNRFDEEARALLDQALTRTLSRKDYQQAVKYVRMMPEPPEDKREELKQTLEEALVEFWNENAFQRMEEITQYMRNNLNTSINLDVELMSFLRAYLESEDVKDKLRATTPEPLLLSAEEAKVDLGPKMAYAVKRFASRPEIIQARLKALAINLEGEYSTANVLHSLRHLFTDENLDELITNALKSAMVNDETLTAVEMATYGESFMKKWPEFFTVNFVVSESLKRVEDISQAQDVWRNTSGEFHDFAAKLRPQLVNLLEGIRLFEAGERTKAAGIFARITDPVYKQGVEPYLQEYGSLVEPFVGTYFYQGEDNGSPVAVLYINEGEKLLEAEVTAISHLGVMERERELVKDRGQVAKISFPTTYDTTQNHMEIVDIDAVVSGLTTNEARTFGKLSHFSIEGETLYLHLTDGKKLPFSQENTTPGFTPLPRDRFGITQTIHTVQPESHVLPVGSILAFSTDRQTVRQDIEDPILDVILTKSVHPVSGTLRHPASYQEIALTGFYDKEKHMLHFEYSYSFDGRETVFDALVRCQALDARITCAGHNRHEKRKRFMTVVSGRKVQ